MLLFYLSSYFGLIRKSCLLAPSHVLNPFPSNSIDGRVYWLESRLWLGEARRGQKKANLLTVDNVETAQLLLKSAWQREQILCHLVVCTPTACAVTLFKNMLNCVNSKEYVVLWHLVFSVISKNSAILQSVQVKQFFLLQRGPMFSLSFIILSQCCHI